jgi:branched-chain amino acid transport system ATP-binding protein
MENTPLLRLSSINTFYGPIHILQDVNIEVFEGEVVCLLGGNASGKSTTLKTILGIVRENLQMGAYLRRDAAGLREDLDRVLALFPRLKERLNQAGGTMSGGEQQMLAIGRALMSRPRLLLMDEPSMGLAPILVEQNFEIIQQINQQGVTVFIIEQNANMALSIAHRGYVLQTGRVVLADKAENLLNYELMRKAYLGR